MGSGKSVTVSGLTLAGTAAGNYTLALPTNLTAAITARPLTASFTAGNKPYDGTTAATILTRAVSNKIGSEDVTLTGGTATFADANVGSSKTVTGSSFSLGGTAAGNYSLAAGPVTTTAAIFAVALTPHISASDKVYDGKTTATLSAQSVTGMVNGETAVGLTVAAANFDTKDQGTTKTVTATGLGLNGTAAGNYSVAATTTTPAAIMPASLVYTATAASRKYGVANPALSGSVTGFVPTETQASATSGTLSFTTPAVATSPVGAYAINGSGLTATNGNYTFAQAPANSTALTVSRADAAVSVTGGSFPYTGTSHAASGFAYGVGGLTDVLSPAVRLTYIGTPNGAPTNSYNAPDAPTAAGTYVATATFDGNTNYTAATNTASLTIAKAEQTLVWNAPAAIVYGDALTATQLNAVRSVGDGALTYAPPLGTVLPAGLRTLTVSAAATSNFNAAATSVDLPVDKAAPVFSALTASQSVAYGTSAVTLTGKVSKGSLLPTGSVTVTINGSVSAPVVLTAGGTFSLTYPTATLGASPTAYSITYAYGGDTNFTAATDATTALKVDKAPATLHLEAASLSPTYTGSAHAATVTTTPTGLSTVTLAYAPITVVSQADVVGPPLSGAPQNAGRYQVTATLDNANYAGSAIGELVIGKASSSLDLEDVTTTYNGLTHPAAATATGAGGLSTTALTYSYSGTGYAPTDQAPTNAGTYAVTATYAGDPNHTGSTSTKSLHINPAAATISVTNLAHTYNSSSQGATVTTTPAGLSVAVTYAGSTTAPTAAGSYAVAATLTNGNYSAADGSGTLIIGQAPLTVVVAGKTKVYGDAVPALTGTLTGVQGDDIITVEYSTPATANSDVVAGGYPIAAVVSSTPAATLSNYSLTTTPAKLTITPARATLSVSGYTGTYDRAAHGATGSATGVLNTNLSSQLALGSSYMSVPGGIAHWVFTGGANYQDAQGDVAVTITPATPMVTATGGNFVYTGAAHAGSATATGAGSPAENLSAAVTLAYSGTPNGTATNSYSSSEAPTAAGSYTVTATYAASTNYTTAFDSQPLTIGKATPLVKAKAAANLVYSASAKQGSGTATGAGDPAETLTPVGLTYAGVAPTVYAEASAAPATVGSYTITASFAGDNNYTSAVSEPVGFSITKAKAVVNVAGYSGTYDGDAHGATGSATGIEGVPLAGLSLGDSFTDAPGGTASWSFAGGLNYQDAAGTAVIAISKADAVVNITPYSSIYDAQAHTASGTASGVKSTDLSAALSFATSFTNVPGGLTNWSFAGGTNYNNQSGSTPVTIGKADATVVVNGYKGIYDGNPHGATGTATGVAGANLNTALTLGDSFTDAPGGTASWSFAGGTNYTNVVGSAAIEIGKANATIVLSNLSPVYSGAANAATALTSPAGLAGVSVSYYQGTPKTEIAAADVKKAGSYAVEATLTNTNYALVDAATSLPLSAQTATLVIAPKALTASIANPGKVYDRTTEAPNTTILALPGVVAPDDVAAVVGTAAFDAAAAGSRTVTAALSLSGEDKDNYSLTSTSATTTASIAQKPLAAALTGTVSKGYDGLKTATLSPDNYSLSGVLAPDAVVLNNPAAGTYADKNVASGKQVTVTGLGISGAEAANYSLPVTAIDALIGSISQRELTISISADDKAYDGSAAATAHASLGTGSGLISGDIVLVAASSAAFDTRNVGPHKTVMADVSKSGADAGNYAANTTATTTASISAIALTASVTAQSKVYDGTPAATIVTRSLSGQVSGDAVTLTGGAATFANKNVGTGKTVTATGLGLSGTDADNYTLASATATTTAAITRLGITGSIVATDKIYDGTPDAAATGSLEGQVSTDLVDIVVTGAAFSNKNVGPAKAVTATLSLSGTDAPNYSLNATAATTASIMAKALTASITALNKGYDGTATASATGSVPATAVISGETVGVTVSNALFSDRNVGMAKTVRATVGLSGSAASNYSLTAATAATTADITAAALTPAFTAQSKEYSGTTAAEILTRTLTGIIDGDEVSLTGGTATFDTPHVGTGKTVTGNGFSLSGAAAGNYRLPATAPFTVANVMPATLTYTATAASRIYGTGNGTLSGTVTGFVGGESLATATSGAAGFASAATATSPIGTYAVVGSGLSANHGNYTFVQAPGNAAALTVVVRPISITADAGQTKVYGASDPAAFAYTVGGSGLAASDSFTGALSRLEGADVGSYAIAQGTLSIKASATNASVVSNYALTYTPRDFTITTKAITVTPTAGQGHVYGTADAALTYEPVALVGSDTFAGSLTRDSGSTVGTYNITQGSLALSPNYTLSFTPNIKFTITRKSLTASIAALNKVYDATRKATATGSVPAAEVISGDGPTLAVVVSSAQFDTKAVGPNKSVTASVALSGAAAPNYSLTAAMAATTATISAASLTPSFTAADKVYDGGLVATITGRSVLGILGADDVALSGGSASFANKNVSPGKTVTGSGFTLTGTDAGNYSLPATDPTASADITPKALTIALGATSKKYDGNTSAVVSAIISAGLVPGDIVTANAASGIFNNKNVGLSKAVTASVSKAGLDAGNYTANTTAGTTADITALKLTAHITAANKVYDGTTNATLLTQTVTGMIGDEKAGLAVTASTFNSKDVPTAKTVTATGLTLTGVATVISNYKLATDTTAQASAAIAPLGITGSFTAASKLYDGSTAATVVSRTPNGILSGDVVTLTGGAAAFDTKDIGTGKTVTLTGAALAGAQAADYSLTSVGTTTAGITAIAPALTVAAPTSVQYSDKITLKATVALPALQTEVNATGGTVDFYLVDAANTTTLLGSSAYPLDWTLVNGVATVTKEFTISQQPATAAYTVQAIFRPNPGNLAGASNLTAATLLVTPEDALVDYTGAQSVATSCTTCGAATLTLSATLRGDRKMVDPLVTNPPVDASTGDIRKAKIRFLVDEKPVVNTSATNGALTDANGWTSVGLVSATDLTTGTVLLKTPVDIGTVDAAQFTVRMEMSGYYKADEATSVINVYKPLNDFVTGGGYIIPTASNGTYASNEGRKTNFGFNVRYNKTGKNLQGNINTIFRKKAADGVVHIYQIKGNAMTSLSVNSAVPTAKTAIFNGKANMQDITNPLLPVSLGGNLTLQVTMTDKGEPGANDQIGIMVYDNLGGVLYSSNWDGVKTSEVTLKGGNIVVNSGTLAAAPAVPTATVATLTAGSKVRPAAGTLLELYPNPMMDQGTIHFHTAQGGKAQVYLYNQLGALVATLYNGEVLSNEEYFLPLNRADLPNGVYVCRLISNGTVENQRFSIEK